MPGSSQTASQSNGRLQLINELQRMNITAESLFPGLDGFARSLMTRAEILGAR